MIEKWSRGAFLVLSVVLIALPWAVSGYFNSALWAYLVVAPFVLTGLMDITQKKKAVLRNFPVLGRFRYFLESIRPEIQQYFIETDSQENPFSREKRSVIYQRAKKTIDTIPFGTLRDVYGSGYEWIAHSIHPVKACPEHARVTIGEGACANPYSASLLNISAMSFGALSKHAILALNKGAKMGDFYHNTGEGGISPYHLESGADLVWQIGTAYFGCRKPNGEFCPDTFREKSANPCVKMIEIKISQGAKPGHGGILPAAKVTREIADIRDIPMGKDVISPPGHAAFDSPVGLMNFVAKLRELSGGKPVGFKICIGEKREFMAVVKAMLKTGVTPDFITVDGAEGGTGAAPLEFTNSVGMPLNNGISFVHNTLAGAGIRDRIKIIVAGKISTGFHILAKLALGADLCNSARAMMFALGCIQARKCNTNHCPVGVATQNPKLYKGLDVDDKAGRVANFHQATVDAALELVGAAGFTCPDQLSPWHIHRRINPGEIRCFAEIYPQVKNGAFLEGDVPARWANPWNDADPDRF